MESEILEMKRITEELIKELRERLKEELEIGRALWERNCGVEAEIKRKECLASFLQFNGRRCEERQLEKLEKYRMKVAQMENSIELAEKAVEFEAVYSLREGKRRYSEMLQ